MCTKKLISVRYPPSSELQSARGSNERCCKSEWERLESWGRSGAATFKKHRDWLLIHSATFHHLKLSIHTNTAEPAKKHCEEDEEGGECGGILQWSCIFVHHSQVYFYSTHSQPRLMVHFSSLWCCAWTTEQFGLFWLLRTRIFQPRHNIHEPLNEFIRKFRWMFMAQTVSPVVLHNSLKNYKTGMCQTNIILNQPVADSYRIPDSCKKNIVIKLIKCSSETNIATSTLLEFY